MGVICTNLANELGHHLVWMVNRNPAPPKGWLKHVEKLKIMGCLLYHLSTGDSDFATIRCVYSLEGNIWSHSK